MVTVSDRLTALETGISLVVTPPLFSDTHKIALDERADANKEETAGAEVNALEKQTILPQQVRFLLLGQKTQLMLIKLHQT